jgi:hypothetical protein
MRQSIVLWVRFDGMSVCVCFYHQIYVSHKKFQYKYHKKLGTHVPKYLSIIFILSRIGFPACKVKIYGFREKKEKWYF